LPTNDQHLAAERIAILCALANHIETLREQEKRAIARELHDDMGAMLTALSIHLQGAYSLFPEDEKWLPRKAKIQSLLHDIVATTRSMENRLRPALLELFGLKPAIGELMTEFAEQSGLACKVSLPDEELPANKPIDIAVYRMLQEILNNVGKHAQATEVGVILDIDDEQLTLTVRDNGVGMDLASSHGAKNLGLLALRERAAFLRGSVTIKSSSSGTIVTISVPISSHAPAPGIPCVTQD